MKTSQRFGYGVVAVLALALADSSALGRGGLGGGGGRGGGFGGGGGSRGGGFSGGGFSGGARPGGSFSGSRPSMGGAPSFSRPSGGVSRPSTLPSRPQIGGGSIANRPSIGGPSAGLTPGSRPPISSRPGQLPAGRPGLDRPGGPGSRPGISTLPAGGVGAGLGAIAGAGRPGFGQRPAQLPGLGRGDRWQQIRENRPDWVSDRRQDLQGRLENRHDSIHDWQNSRQDFLNNRREDWQNWLDDRYPWHDGWHHGYWHGPWGGYWEHMWEEHPVWAAFGLTSWIVNSAAYTFGVWGYSNPYYEYVPGTQVVYDYSQPIVACSAEAPPATAGQELPPGVSQAGLDQFNQAREAFTQGSYRQALNLADQALKAMPNDAVIHEFRALSLFALGQYRPAAAALHAVLAVGPGWDWTTLSSLYPDVDTYTRQLRKLEEASRAQPDQADLHFVLAYHYMTMGHSDAAAKQLQRVLQSIPGDSVARQLYEMITYKATEGAGPKPAAETPVAGPKLAVGDLAGTWRATGPGNSTFEMTLTTDGQFTWKYSKGTKEQVVRGAFAVDANTLAMEPESGGVMVAQLTSKAAGTLEFKMVGSKDSDPPLTFTRQ